MPLNFVCPTCFKSFKTNQHLNQHKNKKKKCQPIEKNPGFDFHLLNTDGGSNNTVISDNSETHNGSELSQITSSIMTSNGNISTSLPVHNLIELIVKYKSALDEIKKIQTVNVGLKNHIQKLHNENILFKKQMSIVQKFISEIKSSGEKDDANIFISPLTDIEVDANNIANPIFLNL